MALQVAGSEKLGAIGAPKSVELGVVPPTLPNEEKELVPAWKKVLLGEEPLLPSAVAAGVVLDAAGVEKPGNVQENAGLAGASEAEPVAEAATGATRLAGGAAGNGANENLSADGVVLAAGFSASSFLSAPDAVAPPAAAVALEAEAFLTMSARLVEGDDAAVGSDHLIGTDGAPNDGSTGAAVFGASAAPFSAATLADAAVPAASKAAAIDDGAGVEAAAAAGAVVEVDGVSDGHWKAEVAGAGAGAVVVLSLLTVPMGLRATNFLVDSERLVVSIERSVAQKQQQHHRHRRHREYDDASSITYLRADICAGLSCTESSSSWIDWNIRYEFIWPSTTTTTTTSTTTILRQRLIVYKVEPIATTRTSSRLRRSSTSSSLVSCTLAPRFRLIIVAKKIN